MLCLRLVAQEARTQDRVKGDPRGIANEREPGACLHFIAVVAHDQARPGVGFKVPSVLCKPADENYGLRLVVEHEGDHRSIRIAGDAAR